VIGTDEAASTRKPRLDSLARGAAAAARPELRRARSAATSRSPHRSHPAASVRQSTTVPLDEQPLLQPASSCVCSAARSPSPDVTLRPTHRVARPRPVPRRRPFVILITVCHSNAMALPSPTVAGSTRCGRADVVTDHGSHDQPRGSHPIGPRRTRAPLTDHECADEHQGRAATAPCSPRHRSVARRGWPEMATRTVSARASTDRPSPHR
jgi:hypothetical protein